MTKRRFNPKPKMGMNAHEVKFALQKMFPTSDGWLTLEELFIYGFDRYVDLWTMRVDTKEKAVKKHRFRYMRIHAIEIKTSRADFQSELREPAKRLAAQAFSNYFSFAAPRGIIEPEEIPAGIGYIEFSGAKGKWIIQPAHAYAESPSWELFAALGRSILKG